MHANAWVAIRNIHPRRERALSAGYFDQGEWIFRSERVDISITGNVLSMDSDLGLSEEILTRQSVVKAEVLFRSEARIRACQQVRQSQQAHIPNRSGDSPLHCNNRGSCPPRT